MIKDIFDNVEKRGYFDGWSMRQVFYRQLVKLLEEVCEAFLSVPNWPPQFRRLREYVLLVHRESRMIFDDRIYFADTEMPPPYETINELADCLIVLSVASVSASRSIGYEIDLLSLATDKSRQDIERGVR